MPPTLTNPTPRTVSLLQCISDLEVQEFLPGPMADTLNALGDPLTRINSVDLDPESWDEQLHAANPEVLVACWSTPRLPVELPPALRYVCYLAGSIKKLVSRKHLENGLIVTNWGHSISRTVAEGALLHILSCMRRTGHWGVAMHTQGAWKTRNTRTASLFERRVGIRGYGRVSHALIELLRPFGCSIGVLAPDVDAARAEQDGIHYIPDLESLMSDHDIVVELAPLIPTTLRSIREEHLRLLKPGSVFVNVGRGATVDEDALERVAREGRIFVGLDVFSTEPLPPDSGFRGLPNISLTPHLAGPTSDRRRDAGAHALASLQRFVAGEPVTGAITAAIYDHST